MSRLMRMVYGHGGTRLERTLVSCHHQEPVPASFAIKLLLFAVWIAVPALVSLYAIPTTSLPMKTIIDISKLSIRPPLESGKPVITEPQPVHPVERHEAPQMQPAAAAEPVIEPTRVRQAVAPRLDDVKRPSIARSAPAVTLDPAEQRVQTSRERRGIDTERETAPTLRLGRANVLSENSSERPAVSRPRGALGQDEPGTRERVAVNRRQLAGDSPAGGAGMQPQQKNVKSDRNFGLMAGTATRDAAPRAIIAGGGAEQSPQTAGATRGVSLMSLEICSSSQKQEEAVKAILAVVGSRQSCTNERGEFQFKGTNRVSSFNLMIFPSKGRRLSNRCEELEDAYTCLKNH